MKKHNFVDTIAFDLYRWQLDDFIIKAAKLEKEGYKVVNVELDEHADLGVKEIFQTPPIHITFKKQ